MVSPARLCVTCKGGRSLCGQNPCPLLARIAVKPKVESFPQNFFGKSPNVFVGREGYPDVRIGPLAAMEEREGIDSPDAWFGRPYGEVIEMRSLLVRSNRRENIFSRSRVAEQVREIAMSSEPVDIEIGFEKRPVFRLSFSDVTQPMGPSAGMKSMRLAENPKIPRVVERVTSDDLKASDAGFELYRKGLDVHRITSIFSAGVIGTMERRKLVPTRYSITGVDDIIAKRLLEGVRDHPSVNEFLVYESEYLDNHFVILLMPGSWEFENFEAWAPGSFWSRSLKDTQIIREYEPFGGRTSYAESQGGGYYASRIAVAEALAGMRRQARVVVFREVYEGYVIPLGVWVVRETARRAFRNRPERFATLGDALSYAGSRTRIPLEEYRKRSVILSQKRLWDF